MPFDAELYLRLAGERMVLDASASRDRPWGSPLVQAARALVAADVIDADAAQTVVDDYDLAVHLRSEDGGRRAMFRRAHRARGAGPSTAMQPRRVVACEQVIKLTACEMRVRFVSLGDDKTSVGAVIWPARPSPRGHRTMAHSSHWSPPQVTLADDRGTSASAHLSGGGSDDEWRGKFTADTPLARDTRWIEIDGLRIGLDREPPAIEVAVQELPAQDPAMSYLWRQLADTDRIHGTQEYLDAAIDALAAAGAVDPAAPELADLGAVRAALGHGAAPHRGIRTLPQPWRSLLARGRHGGGRRADVVVGAVTPEFDGICVAVMSLESEEEGFEVEVETTRRLRALPYDPAIEDTGLAWWAVDDRGNHYLGDIGSWGGTDQHQEGTVNYWPALNPKAARLDLMPTAKTARAVISVPLPWAAAGAR